MLDNTLFCCDICKSVFLSYEPELVIVNIPRDDLSRVIYLCPECEAQLSDVLSGNPGWIGPLPFREMETWT